MVFVGTDRAVTRALVLAGLVSLSGAIPHLGKSMVSPAIAADGPVEAVKVVLAAIEADPAKLDSFCALMTELGKGAFAEGDGRAEQVGALITALGPTFEQGFDYEPASPEGIAFEDGVATLYERCGK